MGQLIHQFMTAFTDHRDSDILIVRYDMLLFLQNTIMHIRCKQAVMFLYDFICYFSHFSLLLGCALPIWMSSGFNDRPLAPFAGILSLGIGDTMVSVLNIDILAPLCF